MGIINGGFAKILNLDPKSIIESNTHSDNIKIFKIIEDNTTYVSTLRPSITNDSTVNIVDAAELLVFWDQTTNSLPGAPTFIESPPDDYHPMSEIEWSEGSSNVVFNNSDRQVRTPHFIHKPDSTSPYYGRDRYDNYMTEALSNFGGRFNWFDGGLNPSTSFNTFNGGDLCSSGNALHMSFMYLKARDATAYLADLYYSRYSDSDGTFQNPVLLESNIDVGGYGSSHASTPQAMNRKTNPKFLNVPNTGLMLYSLRSRYNTISDSTEFFMDVKISRDDGTNWSQYNSVPLKFVWNSRKDTAVNFNKVNEFYCPYIHLAQGGGKIVCMLEFRDYRNSSVNLLEKEHINLLVSEDNGKTFNYVDIDFSKIFASLSSYSDTDYNRYILGTIYYDPKLSKFVMIVGFTTSITTPLTFATYAYAVLVNYDNSLKNWDVVIRENLGTNQYFRDRGVRRYETGFYVSENDAGNETYMDGHGPKFISHVDEEGICWTVWNCGLSYKAVADGNVHNSFDDYADYSGWNASFDYYSWIPASLLVPIELMSSTDSYLNRYRFGTGPWRARKLATGNIDHKNNADSAGISPGGGASLSIFQDAIINGNERVQAAETAGSGSLPRSAGYTSPINTFYIQSITRYKNRFFMLGTDNVVSNGQENRFIDYQIPTLIHTPDWSNVNFKSRKINYLTPTKYYDSTFIGWGLSSVVAGQDIRTDISGKYWQIKFFRTNTPGSGTFNCSLKHEKLDTAFEGKRGVMWEADATRGVACHFIAHRDSRFQNDITSIIHALYVSNRSSLNVTGIYTSLGKDHFGFSSVGGSGIHLHSTFPADSTREMEFMVINNRYRSIDTTHEHRGYFRYHGNSDWTLMYYNLTSTIASTTTVGIYLGNIIRWPTTITGDATNVIYYKYHAESWSAWEMHRQTSNLDNKQAVLPQPCLHTPTYLKNGLGISWSGQDSTCNSHFLIKQIKTKNSAVKMFDNMPSIAWKSTDMTQTFSMVFDLGKSVAFNFVSLYKHNVNALRFYYGQENNSTDLTAFLYHENGLNIDATNENLLREFSFACSNIVAPQNCSIVDTRTLLVYDKMFLNYVKRIANDIIGKTVIWGNKNYDVVSSRRVSYCEIMNDSSVYIQFQHNEQLENQFISPAGASPVWGPDDDVNPPYKFYFLENKHFYKLPNIITARYIKIESRLNMDSTDTLSVPGHHALGALAGMDNFYKIGSLNFGIIEENENPIENNFRTTYSQTSVLQNKYAGGKVPVSLNDEDKKVNSFSLQINASLVGKNNQLGQVEYLLKDLGVMRDEFIFIPKHLNGPDGILFTSSRLARTHGFEKMSLDFYVCKLNGSPTIQKNGNVANVGLNFTEVI